MKRKRKNKRKHLIKTNILEYIIELVILSGYIINADPLSLIIAARVGAGKTELIKLFRKARARCYGSQMRMLRADNRAWKLWKWGLGIKLCRARALNMGSEIALFLNLGTYKRIL